MQMLVLLLKTQIKILKMKKQNNFLLIIAILAITIAVVNFGVTFYKIGGLSELTGHATDTGTANLTIVSQASLQFVTNNINWESGAVDEAPTSATIDSEGTVDDGNWTIVNQGLTLQNDGNTNISLQLTTSNVAAAFIGGSEVTPSYMLKVDNNETDSCIVNNMSSYTEATGVPQAACDNFGYVNTADAVDINVQLVIPEDALPGAKGSVITATGTVF